MKPPIRWPLLAAVLALLAGVIVFYFNSRAVSQPVSKAPAPEAEMAKSLPQSPILRASPAAKDEAKLDQSPQGVNRVATPAAIANAAPSANPAASANPTAPAATTSQQPPASAPRAPLPSIPRKFDPRFVQPATRRALPAPTEAEREARFQAGRAESDEAKQRGIAWARANGLPSKGRTPGGGSYEIVGVGADGIPIYLATQNFNAAITTGVTPWLRGGVYDLRGAGWLVGVWDADSPRYTHREFFDGTTYRALPKDEGAGLNDPGMIVDSHHTHVLGTLIGRGVDADATGMAPDAGAFCFNSTGNTSEMEKFGAAKPDDPGKVYISNHSYGNHAGWANFSEAKPNSSTGESGWHWIGAAGETTSRNFGRYSDELGGYGPRAVDRALKNCPYHLAFVAASNDRGQEPGFLASVRWPKVGGGWHSGTYGLGSGAPGADGGDDGYDTLGEMAVAKNVMTVGNLEDAVDDGVRSTEDVDLVDSSSIGPTDDGRIKPDIVANGEEVYSADSGANDAYGEKTGTSMASPNAAGTALLLHQWYKAYTDQYFRASTLKALIIHTALDLGTGGPDYRTGWGLIDGGAALDHLVNHYNEPGAHHIIEAVLDSATPQYRLNFRVPPDTAFVFATLCWTDVPGVATTALNDGRANLANDLDVRLISSNGTIYFPFRLNPDNPSANATLGDNTRDNVEKVGIAFPSSVGVYELIVSHKRTLLESSQVFSVMLSGNAELNTGTVAEGLDRPETQGFSFSGNRTWAFESDGAANDGDRVTSLPLADNGVVDFATIVEGGQTVTFDWGVSSEPGFDKLRFFVDDILISEISGEVATTTYTHAVSGGTHHLRWEYKKDGSQSGGQDRGWVDKLLFNNLAEAVDDLPHAYEIVPGSGVPWVLEQPGDNDYAACYDLGINQFSAFTTTIQGPAVVAFRMTRLGNYGDLFCSYGPGLTKSVSSTVHGSWEDFQIQLDPGPQEVRWTFHKLNPGGGPSNGSGYVDQVVVISEPVPLRDALNLPGELTTPVLNGRGAWTAANTAGAPIDVDRQESVAVETSLTVPLQPVHLTQKIFGSGGLFSFWWRAGGPTAASMSVLMRSSEDGTPIENRSFVSTDVESIPGGTGWQQGFLEVPAGVTEVRFSYNPADSVGQGGLDRFSYIRTAQHPARGLDRWSTRWETLGDAAWAGVYDPSNGGLDSLTHTDIGDGQSTSLTTTVIGPKILIFSWKVSSEEGFDFLRLFLDGEEVDRTSGERPWVHMQIDISAGPHTLRWVYQKDATVSEGFDVAWLDSVAFLRPDWGIVSAKPISSTQALLVIKKDPWPGYIIEKSTDLVTWTQSPLNTVAENVSVIVPASGPKNFFRLRFAPEQRQTIENSGFELPVAGPNAFWPNGPGWGPDNDGATATSFEHIPGFAYAGNQHLSIDQGFIAFTNFPTVLYPGRHSLTVAIGNRSGFTQTTNRSGYALTDSGGNSYGSASVFAGNTSVPESTIPPGAFRLGYPFSIAFDTTGTSLDVYVVLTSPGAGRSFFDEVILVSEPQ